MIDMEKVRLSETGDEMSLVTLVQEVHRESGFFPMDTIAVLSTIRRGIARDGAMIGVVGDVGDVRGAVMLTVNRMWYAAADDGTFLSELFMIVSPQHRRSTCAKHLMEFSKEAARRLGFKLLIGTASTERTEAKIRLYRRQFPHKVGESFLFDGGA